MDTRQADLELIEEISVYARISVDTEKENDDNTSIENQLKIITNYIKNYFPKCKVKEYVDRDQSGYTFDERDNYGDMRKALLSGKSKILIVKDFSRFSRRTSLGLLELENYKDAGVRIISIMDGADFPTRDDWLSICMRFITNEMPVTETSKKVKKSIKVMQSEGEWLCAVPYGYQLQTIRNRQVAVVVPDEAVIVREIYRLYAYEGWGYKKIANYLTDKNIPTPRMKEKMRAEAEGKDYRRKVGTQWAVESLQTILTNDFYIGTYRGNKFTRVKINGKDRKVDKAENIVIKEHHEPILDNKVFMFTQEQLKQRTSGSVFYRGVPKYESPYTGYIFCGDCGARMSSRSVAKLEPSYICGAYQQHGLKACTSHHIKFEFLDKMLKDYVKLVKLNCAEMITELERAIATEAESVQTSDKVIELLQNQLSTAKEELKATKKKKIKELTRGGDEELIEEVYAEIEQEITDQIHGIQEQLKIALSNRNDVVEIARVSKTVFEVFDNVINKEHLDRVDVALIVERITVFENGQVEIKLKADIEQLLVSGTLPNEEEKIVNFNFDSIDEVSLIAQYTERIPKRRAKVYTVNVVNEGDPLEIFTESDGTVIFKKYSPIGELGEFAHQYAESLAKTTGLGCCISDKDTIIAVSGAPKKELADKKLSSEAEKIMQDKTGFLASKDGEDIAIVDGNSNYKAGVIAPIVFEGDSIGTVMIISPDGNRDFGDVESKLAEVAAGFLGKTME